MCGDCWNAAMGAPMAVAAGRFAWVGYRDRLPFLGRGARPSDGIDGAEDRDDLGRAADERVQARG